MKPIEAELLLGGYATGNLTLEERQKLFAAALEHQGIFDALMDEETLRELLADPVAKAQLIAALAPSAVPKIVPFWRRTGVLGAAAGLMVAATAGLAYLRSPEKGPPPLQQEAPKAPEAKAAEPPGLAQAPTPPARKAAALPAQVSKPAQAPLVEPESRAKEQEQSFWSEAQDKQAKKAEAPRPPAALMEVAPAQKVDKQKANAQSQHPTAGGLPGGAISGLAAGVASQIAATDQAERARRDAAPSPAPPAPAKAARRVEWKAAAVVAPTWTLDSQPDGTTRVLVKGPAGVQAVLLRRRAHRVEVLPLKVVDVSGDLTRWRTEVRLAAGDALDLYLLNTPVADPAKLPETGPVDGYRARIFPAPQ